MRGTIDPDVKRVLARLAASRGPESWTVEAKRKSLDERTAWLAGPAIELPDVHDDVVRLPRQAIRIRVYDPRGTKRQPLIVYAHGGGWALGSLESHDTLCRALAEAGQCIVGSIDYRLAPESTFPAALNDVIAVTRSLAAGNHQFDNWDGRRLGIAGDSAGGNLAAATAMSLRGDVDLSCVLLAYPILDSDLDRPAYLTGVSPATLDRAEMSWYWEQYCPDPDLRQRLLASPLRATDLHGFPRTCLVAPEFDILRAEALEFADHLRRADVPVDWIDGEGLPHGFLRMLGAVPAARSIVRRCGDFLKGAFGHSDS